MRRNLEYPNTLSFPNHFLRNFAESLKPYSLAFFEGEILCDPSEGWENVFFHCLSEAVTVKVLCDEISDLDTSSMILAAFLHDAFKRREVEAVDRSQINKPQAFLESEAAGKTWLRSLGYDDAVVHLQTAFGDTAARKIFLGEIDDFERRLLHYVDDITHGDQIVPVDQRMTTLENNPRYAEQNEWHRQFFGGLSLYQAKRQIHTRTEQEVATKVGIQDPGALLAWIKERRAELFANSPES
ncbi:MAG: hypothetical protein AB7T49_15810 [Oligoflexales bacterium]